MRAETFPTPGAVALDLNLAAGEIHVEAVAGLAETTVELEPLHGEAAERLVEEARVEVRPGRDGAAEVVVQVLEPRRLGVFRSGAEIRLTVRCPERARLHVRAASAEIRARGLLGAAELESASGDIEVEAVEGAVRAKGASSDLTFGSIGGGRLEAASGDVEVRRITGEARIRTASGDVRVGTAEGSLEVQTASGDQEIDDVVSGRVALKAMSGDVRVGVRRGSGVWVDASSMSGETSSELDLGEDPGDADGPTLELEARTMSGDVRIVRAAAQGELTA
jgi:Putative adhesin